MTDPIERVARWLAEINHEDPDRAVAWNIEGGEALEWVWHGYKFIAASLIDRFIQQGIPVEKLLSGEMKAVPAGFLEAAVPINNAERLVVEYAVMKCGHETVELTAAVMNLREMRKQAQLDYAGNPPVTPDLAQTDLQKKG